MVSHSRFVAWTAWILVSVFYAYQYILRVMPSIMMPDMMRQFDIDTVIFGQLSGVYYIGYSCMHLPIGILLDRCQPRKVMSTCILLTVIGLLPMAFTDDWIYPVVGRALIGMGSSAAILGTFKIIRMTFSEQHFARMLSFSVTIGLLGAIYGGAPVSYMCQSIGYKAVIQIFALMGVVLAVVTYVMVPNMESTCGGTVFSDVKIVLGNVKVVICCLCAGFMVGPLEGFADVWGTEFLKQVYQFDNATAARLPSMMFVGMCFGAPILTFIAEKTVGYVKTVVGSGVVMALGFFALLLGQFTSTIMSLVFVVVGVCCAYQILAIYKASTYVPKHVAGLTTAVANMIIMSFGYAFHTIIGIVIHAMGGHTSSQAFVYGVGVIPVALCIGVLGFAFLSRISHAKAGESRESLPAI